MKLHLPKGILLGLMAAVSVSAAAESTSLPDFYNVVDDVVTVTEAKTWDTAGIEEGAKFIAKDGTGKLTYTGSGTIDASIYIREGELQIGGESTKTELTVRPQSPEAGAPVYRYGINVGGKDSTLRLDNAKVTLGSGSTIVGGQNGNGKLILENGSELAISGSEVMVIGDMNWSCGTTKGEDVTETLTDANWGDYKYTGTYSDAADGSGATLGRGDVTVSGGSTLSTPRSFYMGEGSLTVTGKDADGNASKVTIGNSDNGYKALIGISENTTSEINVADGAKLEIHAGEFTSNYAGNTSTNINITGKGSEFKVTKAEFALIGNDSSKTNMTISDGASATFDSQYVYFGAKDSDSCQVNVKIEEESTLSGNILVRSGATIENEGTIIQDEGTWLQVISTGGIVNKGTLDALTWIHDGGELTATDGSTMGEIFLGSGTMRVEGTVNMQGMITGASIDGEIIFTTGGSLNMNGYAFKQGDINLVLEVGESVTDLDSLTLTRELITGTDINADTEITVRHANGSEIGTIKVGDIPIEAIPEPTTATLSLLALAGLAARRRRR